MRFFFDFFFLGLLSLDCPGRFTPVFTPGILNPVPELPLTLSAIVFRSSLPLILSKVFPASPKNSPKLFVSPWIVFLAFLILFLSLFMVLCVPALASSSFLCFLTFSNSFSSLCLFLLLKNPNKSPH